MKMDTLHIDARTLATYITKMAVSFIETMHQSSLKVDSVAAEVYVKALCSDLVTEHGSMFAYDVVRNNHVITLTVTDRRVDQSVPVSLDVNCSEYLK